MINLLPAYAATPRTDLGAMMNKILFCDAFELMAQLPDESIDCILCDLPYGVINDAFEWDIPLPLGAMWQVFKRVIKPKGAILLTATEPFASQLRSSNYAMYRDDYVYPKATKTRFLDANKRPLLAHEYVLVFGERLPAYYPKQAMGRGEPKGTTTSGAARYVSDKKLKRVPTYTGNDRYPTTILPRFYTPEAHDGSKQMNKKAYPLHPTQKPVDLFTHMLNLYTQAGDVVLDPCVGSGTTALACLKIGRNYICGDNGYDTGSGRAWADIAQQRINHADPSQDKQYANGEKQLSLLKLLEVSA